jgi:hypothetical protein
MFEYNESFDVSDPNILSDHCIVSFSFVLDKPCINDRDNEYDNVKYKYVWSYDMKDHFIEGLSTNCMLEKLNIFSEQVHLAENKQDIDECISHFSNLIEDVASPLFRKQMNDQLHNEIFPDNNNTNTWFNEECFEKRAVFIKC